MIGEGMSMEHMEWYRKGKTCPSGTLSNIISTLNGLWLTRGLRFERSATECLCHDKRSF